MDNQRWRVDQKQRANLHDLIFNKKKMQRHRMAIVQVQELLPKLTLILPKSLRAAFSCFWFWSRLVRFSWSSWSCASEQSCPSQSDAVPTMEHPFDELILHASRSTMIPLIDSMRSPTNWTNRSKNLTTAAWNFSISCLQNTKHTKMKKRHKWLVL